MAFHGRWGSGQLLSRATTDLSAIRRFAGFGLLFLLINIVPLTATTVVLLTMYWPLGIVVAAASAPIVWLSMRFEKSYVVISRRVQDEQGDLATHARRDRATEGEPRVRVDSKRLAHSRVRLGRLAERRVEQHQMLACWRRPGRCSCSAGSFP